MESSVRCSALPNSSRSIDTLDLPRRVLEASDATPSEGGCRILLGAPMATEPLTKETVEVFIAAPKQASTATNGAQLNWAMSGMDSAVAVLTVELEGRPEGLVRLIAGYETWKHWNLILQWRNEHVYAWHFKENGVHPNPGCPPEFPRKAPNPHEHLWVAGHDLVCALPLVRYAEKQPPNLETCLLEFCQHINLDLEPAYAQPPVGEQMSILPEPK
jgi:hypothetical protein